MTGHEKYSENSFPMKLDQHEKIKVFFVGVVAPALKKAAFH